MPKFKDLTGQKFNRLTVIQRAESHVSPNGMKRTMWQCICDCGGVVSTRGAALTDGTTQSCGCLHREASSAAAKIHSTTHGMCRTPEYRVYKAMVDRCYNKNVKNFHRYGGRGITVCDRWRSSFANFFSDMGARPTEDHSLDRIDNDGPYSPENCKWATSYEQNRNRRSNIYVTHNGETLTVCDWSARLGGSHGLVSIRLKKGWPVSEAVTTPPILHGRRSP